MDFRELQHKMLGNISLENIWYTDTQGELLPAGAPLYGKLNASNPVYWKWTQTSGLGGATRIGSQRLGAQFNTSLSGDGASTSFGPSSFTNAPLLPGSVNLWTVITGKRYSWTDSDGNKGAMSSVPHAVGDGATTAFTFTSKAIAIEAGTLQIEWISGGANYSVTDDGAGAFTDAKISSSTINYETGDISVTFDGGHTPDNNTLISLTGGLDTYFDVYFNETLALGNGTASEFSYITDNERIRGYSLLVSYTISGTVYYAKDDGIGNLIDLYGSYIAVGSVVNYDTGEVLLILSTAPDQNTLVEISYNTRGLIKSTIDYATGSVSMDFHSGHPPDPGETVFLLSSHQNHSDFAGVTARNGILLVNESAARIQIREARGYLDTASEGFDGSIYSHYCIPGDKFSLNAYVKRLNGTETGYLRIRFWDGTSSYSQISAGTEQNEDYNAYSGVFAVVDDPYDATKKIYEFSSTNDTVFERCSLNFKVPAGARTFSVEFETDDLGWQEGELAFHLSGLQLSRGATDVGYSPSPEVRYLPRPQDGSGRDNQILTWSEYGGTSWTDPSTLAIASINSLNGLTAATQELSTGTSGTSPNWASAAGNHTLNIPLASAAGVVRGLVSHTNYTAWQNLATGTFNQAANPNTFTREILPAADNSIDLGGLATRWRNIYGVNVVATSYSQIGGATDYARWMISGGSTLAAVKNGTVTDMDLTTFVSVQAAIFGANRVSAFGISDVVHLEVTGHTTQTSNLFNIQNQGGSSYLRGDNSLNITHIGNWDITNNLASKKGFRLRADGSQTADIWSIESAAASQYARIDKDGHFYHSKLIAASPGTDLFLGLKTEASTGKAGSYITGSASDSGETWTFETGSGSVATERVTWTRVGDCVVVSGFISVTVTAAGSYIDLVRATPPGGISSGSVSRAVGTVVAEENTGTNDTFVGHVMVGFGNLAVRIRGVVPGGYYIYFSGIMMI